MGKLITLSESDLRKYVQNVLFEHIEELSKIDDKITIYTYDLSNDDDLGDISNIIEKLWDILVSSYENIGGIKGIRKPQDLIKKHNLVRVAYLDNNIIAVSFYSNRLGGNKMTYCGTTGASGKVGLMSIISRDNSIENIEEFNWVECSGGVEKLFRRSGGFNLPNIYASEVLGSETIKLDDDGYHYERQIGVNSSDTFIKTIYGFNSEELIKKVYNDIYGNLINDIKYIYTMLKNNETIVKESESISLDREKVALIIIEKFDELHSYSDINEFPLFLIEELRKNVNILISTNEVKHKINIDLGLSILSKITEFKIIKKQIKIKELNTFIG